MDPLKSTGTEFLISNGHVENIRMPKAYDILPSRALSISHCGPGQHADLAVPVEVSPFSDEFLFIIFYCLRLVNNICVNDQAKMGYSAERIHEKGPTEGGLRADVNALNPTEKAARKAAFS